MLRESFALLLLFVTTATLSAQSNLLFSEDFSTDGDGERYTLTGRGINSTVTPVRGFDHSFLMPTVEPGGMYVFPARRAAVPWSASATDLSDSGRDLIASTIEWAGDGSTNISMLTGGSLQPAETALQQTLADAGYTVTLVTPQTFDAASSTDLLFLSDTASAFDVLKNADIRSYAHPIVTAHAGLAADLLLTSDVGQAIDRQSLQFSASNDMVDLSSQPQPFPAFGTARSGVEVQATYLGAFATQVQSLDVVDAMLDGRSASVTTTAMFEEADFSDGDSNGFWNFDNEVPGGGGDDYAIVATGTIEVTQAGTFGFGITGNDGGRLRINGQTIVSDNVLGGFSSTASTMDLPAGDHTFQWVGFERAGNAEFELAVTPDSESFGQVDNLWDVLATDSVFDEIRLKEPMQVTTYQLDVANSPLVVTDSPASLMVEEGATTDVQRSPFRTTDGSFLFASGFNAAGFEDTETPRTITFPPVDVSGAADPKLTIGMASVVNAWEDAEGVTILVNDEPLVEFRGDVFQTMTDGESILASSFKNLTYDLPDGIDSATVSIEIVGPDNDHLVGIDSVRISDGPLEGVEKFQPPTPNSFQQGVNGYTGTVDHELWVAQPDRQHPVFVTDALIADLAGGGDELSEVLSLQVDGAGDETHVLIRFEDIFGEGGIPVDAEIESATLTLEAFDDGDMVSLHRMLTPWELTDTWNSRGDGIQPDGVEAAVEEESRSGDVDIEIGPAFFDVTESLRFFQENPEENHGWVLFPSGSNGNSFLASEVAEIPDALVAFVNENVATFTQVVPEERLAPLLSFVLAEPGGCVIPDGLTGDLDGDGQVAFSDFLTLSANFGSTGDLAYQDGDMNCDGQVAFADFLLLSENFGATEAAAASVPEPAGAATMLVALVLVGNWFRRRN